MVARSAGLCTGCKNRRFIGFQKILGRDEKYFLGRGSRINVGHQKRVAKTEELPVFRVFSFRLQTSDFRLQTATWSQDVRNPGFESGWYPIPELALTVDAVGMQQITRMFITVPMTIFPVAALLGMSDPQLLEESESLSS